jgi:hypothetical protein
MSNPATGNPAPSSFSFTANVSDMSRLPSLSNAALSFLVNARGRRLLTAALVCAGMFVGLPLGALGQDAETPSCSEPGPCPATDTTQNPEVTCVERKSNSDNDLILHLYGRHLAKEGAAPAQLIYRKRGRSGRGGRTEDDFEVKSTCHVVTTLQAGTGAIPLGADSIEFRLQREPPTPEEAKNGGKGTVSDWHYLKVTTP